MEELKQIEERAIQLQESTISILQRNYPMDSRDFLKGADKEQVDSNDREIVELANRYLNAFKTMSLEEQRSYDYKNIQGNYYQATHKVKGLELVYAYSDEYELQSAFSKATDFGKKAIEEIHRAQENNDTELEERNKEILSTCIGILKTHFWGENRIEYLRKYQIRLQEGRTIEDDLEEYRQLMEETKTLSLDYAKTIMSNPNEQTLDEFHKKFEEIFKMEQELSEFLPVEMRKTRDIHWMKVNAERTPEKFIETYDKDKTI